MIGLVVDFLAEPGKNLVSFRSQRKTRHPRSNVSRLMRSPAWYCLHIWALLAESVNSASARDLCNDERSRNLHRLDFIR